MVIEGNHESHDTCDHQDHAHHVYVDSFDRCCDCVFQDSPSAIRNIEVPMPKTASEVGSVVLAAMPYPMVAQNSAVELSPVQSGSS